MTQSPRVIIKLVIFTIIDSKLTVYLPDKKLPHKLVHGTQLLDNIVEKITKESLGSTPKTRYLEQLYTFSSEDGITVAYFLLFKASLLLSNKQKQFVTLDHIVSRPDISIIEYALQRLRWKVEYTNVVYSLLPDEFTLSQLQQTYEAILGRSLDKRNFRKKILSLGLLKLSDKKLIGIKARPAQMYEFKERKPVRVRVF